MQSKKRARERPGENVCLQGRPLDFKVKDSGTAASKTQHLAKRTRHEKQYVEMITTQFVDEFFFPPNQRCCMYCGTEFKQIPNHLGQPALEFAILFNDTMSGRTLLAHEACTLNNPYPFF